MSRPAAVQITHLFMQFFIYLSALGAMSEPLKTFSLVYHVTICILKKLKLGARSY